jgi:histidine ammonia-lyase
MGANEARHVLEMTEDLGHVLALELYTAAQALDYRREMLNAARRLAAGGDWQALAAKISCAPREDSPHYAQFVDEVRQLMLALAQSRDFDAGSAVQAAHALLREHIPFMHRDRAMDGDVRTVCDLQQQRAFAAAARPWLLADVPPYP